MDSVPTMVTILNCLITVLSMASTIWIVYLCHKTKPYTVAIQLISILSFSDLFFSVSNFLPVFQYEEGSVMCNIEAHTKMFFFSLSVFMGATIAVYHYKLANLNRPFSKEKFMYISTVISIILSFVLTFGTFYSDSIIAGRAEDSACCTIMHVNDGSLSYRMFAFFFVLLPTGLGILVSIFCYAITVRRIKKASNILLGQSSNEISTLFWLPGVLFITLFPYLVTNTIKNCFSTVLPAPIVHIEMLMTHSIGLTNSVTYCLQRKLYASKKLDRSNFAASVSEHLETKATRLHARLSDGGMDDDTA